jgi:hypothetical protein
MEDLTNMIKPVVHYIGEARFYEVEVDDGFAEYARVYGVDHPILGKDNIRTSLVVKKHGGGSFETLNTIYKPLKEQV